MKSQTILITGATSGIGRHAAAHLAARGHKVFATGRRQHALDELAQEVPGIETIRLDVTDADSIALARERVLERTAGRGLDVLVNNAGFGGAAPVELVSDCDFRSQYETNVFGLMAMIRAFLPEMRERGAGRVLNVSSIAGRVTFPLFGVYNSTKYAVESLSDALRMELKPFGVHVVLIEPGVINTEFADRTMEILDRYREASSPYAPVLERADEMREMTDRMGVGPLCVSRAMHRAIESRRPRARYVAPFRSRFILGFMAILPTRWSDALLRSSVGLTRKGLARGATGPRPASARA